MVSIIIPVYNCEHSILRTLNSIAIQTYRDFEIVIVNDGSTDLTEAIIKEYIGKHTELRIMYQATENGGPGNARNIGLCMMHGDYVVFVDADDIVDSKYLEILLNGLNDMDFCFASYYKVTDGNEEKKTIPKNEYYGVCSPENIFVSFIGNKTYISLWNSIFITSTIHEFDLHFLNNCRSGEDIEFITRYLMCCNNVNSLKDAIYTFYFDSKRGTQRWNKHVITSIQDSAYWPLLAEMDQHGWKQGKLRHFLKG